MNLSVPLRPLVACLGLLVALGCWGCSDPLRDVTTPEDLDSMLEKQLRVDDLSVLMTSGTLILREIHSRKAVFFEEERSIQATSVTLKLNLPEQQQRVTASALTGEVYLGKKKKGDRISPDDLIQPIGYDAMREVAQAPSTDRFHGDIVLRGDVEGITEDGGYFKTQMVLWSESLHRLLVPEPFVQLLPPPGGGRILMEGEAFEVDSTLRHWTYYGDKQPFALEWDAAQDPPRAPATPGLAPKAFPVARSASPDSPNTSQRRSSTSR